jgi:hypothetical protein
LDWRLALDLAAIATAQPISLSRWLAAAEPRARAFAESFSLEVVQLESLLAAYDSQTRRAAIFGHPLWRRDEAYWVEEQVIAADEIAAAREVASVEMYDMLTLIRYPSVPAAWLTARDVPVA